ncbi:ABC transporter ATP-binding protein/permease [Clostridium sp. SHJSY1]|uniref:ABC transporter ATP-binding protein n=1 Tax=Clostridium sp. SHJSY1 TaxID=2942483 RepID=UPI002876FA78|nr:ABC transporter ATP-binding protein [Clostridium sp. SHJSY1]MDS0527183.1 ABC transporter ATP-binding protein/permease [Clostridium sp. SHJSY1]
MLKMIKYMKKSALSVIAIIALLVLQAVCDLALPDYTSNIVNVGIQQHGIENSVPEVISKSDLDNLLTFMNDEDKDEVLDNYNYLDKASQATKKDVSGDEPAYELKTQNEDTINKLNNIFSKPMLVVSVLTKDSEETASMKEQMIANFPPQMVAAANGDVLKIFSMLPKDQMGKVRDEINNKFQDMPDTIISQGAVSYVKDIYDDLGIDTDGIQKKYIIIAGAQMLGIALISMIATVAVGFLGARVAAKLGRDLRSKVFRKVVNFSNTELDKFSTASLITRSTNDIQQIQLLMVMILRIVFYAPILGLGGVIKVLNTNTSMAWIIGVAVLVLLAVILLLFAIVMPKFKAVQKLVDKLNLVTREILTGILVIRAFNTEKHEEERFDEANKNLTKTNLFVTRTMSLMMPVMMLIMNAITVLIVWNGSHSVNDGTMQVGDMMAFITYTMQIIMSFLMISMVSIMLPRASVSAGRIEEVLQTDFIIKDPKEKKAFDLTKKGIVEFKNVSFRYPNADEDVIENISFTAKPGQTTAFIGSTGSGKSTLINLIPRFYDVTNGEILIEGINIKDVPQKELREKIGYVPQKGVLFSGTIESNLKYGKKDATASEIEKAAAIAQATEFITSKPEAFETEISQGGTNVSGGQKQRLSIARAIAKDPEIYIFDDSFSALDFKTDATLRKALKNETSNSTVFIVAQRISTILNAEQIIVLDEGKVVGIGNHKELLNNCEVYKQIALSQLSKEELENE